MVDWLNNALQSGIQGIFEMIAQAFIKILIDVLSLLTGSAKSVLDLEIVKNGILLSQALAATLLAVKVAYEAVFNKILSANGGSGSNPGDLLIGTVKSAVIIATVPWLVRWMYKFGTTLTQDINNLNGASLSDKDNINEVMSGMISHNPLIIGIGIIIAVVFVLIIIIQSFIRSAELAFIALVGAIMATGLATNSPLFKTWWNELLSISLTQGIQILMVKLAFTVLMVAEFSIPFENLLLFIGFLWVAYKTPNTIKQYTHSTGMSGIAGGLASTGANATIMRIATRMRG